MPPRSLCRPLKVSWGAYIADKAIASRVEVLHGSMVSSIRKRSHMSTNGAQRIDENVDEDFVFEEEMTLMKNLQLCLNEVVTKDDP